MRCSGCNKTIPSTVKFCAYCGARSPALPRIAPKTPTPQLKPTVAPVTMRVPPRRWVPTWVIWAVVIFVLVAIASVIGFQFQMPHTNSLRQVPAPVSYPIVVNYGLSLQDMIEAGEYGRIYQSDVINQIAPSGNQGINEVEIILVYFNRWIYSEDVLLLLEERHLRPATFEELLTFGATYPNEQRRVYKIAALGSPVWGTFEGLSGRYDPYLACDGNIRCLAALWSSFSRWDPETGFAAVVNISGVGVATAPSAPQNLTVTDSGDGYVNLAWDAPSSNGGAAITNYKIYRGTSSGDERLYSTTTTTGTTFQNTSNIVNGTAYYYKVTTVNAVGESPFSNEVSTTPQAAATAPVLTPTELNLTAPQVWSPVWTTTLEKPVKSLDTDGRLVVTDGLFGVVHALEAVTGKVVWTYSLPAELEGSGSLSAVEIHGEVVFIGGPDQTVYALTLSDGQLLWKRSLLKYPGVHSSLSLSVATDRVLVGSASGFVAAIDMESGQVLWEFATNGQVHSAPCFYKKLVLTGAWEVYALDISTGSLVWSFDPGVDTTAEIALDGHSLYVASYNSVYALDAETGRVVWRTTLDGRADDIIKVGPGKVFAASSGRPVYALDMTQGQIVWTRSLEGGFGGWAELVGNEMLILGDPNANNNIFVLNAETGEILRRWSNPRAWFFRSKGEMFLVNTATAVHLLKNSEAESVR